MKPEEMSKEILEYEISKSKMAIEEFERTLRYLPETSILGRFSIGAYLKKERKRLVKLEAELSKRI